MDSHSAKNLALKKKSVWLFIVEGTQLVKNIKSLFIFYLFIYLFIFFYFFWFMMIYFPEYKFEEIFRFV